MSSVQRQLNKKLEKAIKSIRKDIVASFNVLATETSGAIQSGDQFILLVKEQCDGKMTTCGLAKDGFEEVCPAPSWQPINRDSVNSLRETFVDLSSGNSVTLSNVPLFIYVVLRNDSSVDTKGTQKWELNGSDIVFNWDFGESLPNETVEIVYAY